MSAVLRNGFVLRHASERLQMDEQLLLKADPSLCDTDVNSSSEKSDFAVQSPEWSQQEAVESVEALNLKT